MPAVVLRPDLVGEMGSYSLNQSLECDGMTRIVTYLLTKEGVPHKVKCGVVFHKGERVVPLHYWVSLPDGKIIDFKLRMWVSEPSAPHGIFRPEDHEDYKYVGRPNPMSVSPFMFNILAGKM